MGLLSRRGYRRVGGEGVDLGLLLDFQGEKLGLVAALSFFGEGLEGLALALVGLLAEGMALFPGSGHRAGAAPAACPGGAGAVPQVPGKRTALALEP